MTFFLPELPYNKADFGKEVISAETFDYHYGKHHQTYVTNLNQLVKGTEWEGKSLDEIVLKSDGKLFNNAAQHWNHTFYWHCITPKPVEPEGALKDAIVAKWGGVDKFITQFNADAAANFGSGWTWLAKKGADLSIVNTSNAGNPLTNGFVPLLTVDVWEHAYYIDYRNARAKYLENFGKIIDWKFVNKNFSSDKVAFEKL